MKKLLFILLFGTTALFGQNKEKALHILFQNVDSTYFTEDGNRWFEFSLPPNRAFKIMDLVESDTTCTECIFVKGKKNYKRYVKEEYPGRKYDKSVFGHMDAIINGHLVMMWMYDEYTFGMITVLTMD
jgi:hypothetical protein